MENPRNDTKFEKVQNILESFLKQDLNLIDNNLYSDWVRTKELYLKNKPKNVEDLNSIIDNIDQQEDKTSINSLKETIKQDLDKKAQSQEKELVPEEIQDDTKNNTSNNIFINHKGTSFLLKFIDEMEVQNHIIEQQKDSQNEILEKNIEIEPIISSNNDLQEEQSKPDSHKIIELKNMEKSSNKDLESTVEQDENNISLNIKSTQEAEKKSNESQKNLNQDLSAMPIQKTVQLLIYAFSYIHRIEDVGSHLEHQERSHRKLFQIYKSYFSLQKSKQV